MHLLCVNMKQVQNYWFSLSVILLASLLLVLRRSIQSEESFVRDEIRKFEIKSTLSGLEVSEFLDDEILDKSGQYFVVSNFSYPRQYYDDVTRVDVIRDDVIHNDVTLVTHSSVDNILQLHDLLQSWSGPVSFTLFVCEKSDFQYIFKFLFTCYHRLLKNVSLHAVFPVGNNCKDTSLLNTLKSEISSLELSSEPLKSCANFENLLRKLRSENYKSQTPYPSNLLRNVGASGLNGFVLHTDVDVVPSFDLYAQLKQFFAQSENLMSQTAFILPIFEIELNYYEKNREKFPCDKNLLKTLVDLNVAQPFYSTVCPKCQVVTNYSKWFRFGNTEKLRAIYKVEWQHSYEPFFVARNSPKFEENFKQYGYNRVSQLCEMHVANWTFFILNSGFLLHVGSKDKFHSTKSEEMRMNYQKYLNFQEMLREKYPNSNRNCKPPPVYVLQ